MTDYEGQPFCTAHIEAVGANYKWPHKNISWAVTADLPGMARDSFRRAVAEAFRRWAAVCGVVPHEANEGEVCNIVIGVQTERPGNVLADCELPVNLPATGRVRMRVDTVETWCISDNPPRDRIDLVRVLCHELGHGLGFSHGPSGCLMAPTYSMAIRAPQAWDIVEARSRYGDPRPVSPPQPQPEPSPPTEGDIELCKILSRGGRMFARSVRNGTEIEL